MINKTRIEKLLDAYTANNEIFPVSIKVTTGNKITVLVNKKEGITIDECVQLSRHIENNLDRDIEDFELSVSSPGLGEPLLVKEQYEMSVGRKLEVIDSEGDKYTGRMKSFSGEGFSLEIKQKQKGKKRELIEHSFMLSEIRKARVLVTFKK